MPFRWTEVQLPPHECGGSHHSSHPRSFGSGLHRSSTPATANSQNQPQDPSTPVSRTGENVREPSCAQDDFGRGQKKGDRGQGRQRAPTRYLTLLIATSATANSQNQPQDPSTPVSRTGENVREPSCAQDNLVGIGDGDRRQ